MGVVLFTQWLLVNCRSAIKVVSGICCGKGCKFHTYLNLLPLSPLLWSHQENAQLQPKWMDFGGCSFVPSVDDELTNLDCSFIAPLRYNTLAWHCNNNRETNILQYIVGAWNTEWWKYCYCGVSAWMNEWMIFLRHTIQRHQAKIGPCDIPTNWHNYYSVFLVVPHCTPSLPEHLTSQLNHSCLPLLLLPCSLLFFLLSLPDLAFLVTVGFFFLFFF